MNGPLIYLMLFNHDNVTSDVIYFPFYVTTTTSVTRLLNLKSHGKEGPGLEGHTLQGRLRS